jgi:hypothetical protein
MGGDDHAPIARTIAMPSRDRKASLGIEIKRCASLDILEHCSSRPHPVHFAPLKSIKPYHDPTRTLIVDYIRGKWKLFLG